MYFSATVREEPIEIRYARGNTNIPLLLKTDIKDKINKIKSSDRLKIGYVHIGGIQVMIRAHFREGINSPVNLAILDNQNLKVKIEYNNGISIFFEKLFLNLPNTNINL